MDTNDLKHMRIGWNRQAREQLYKISIDHANPELMKRLLDDLFMSDKDFAEKMKGV